MKPYLQTTEFTTAASSLLTIIHFMKPEIEDSKEKEFEIWRSTVNLPTRASSIYALANYAKKQGLNPKIVLEKKEYEYPDYRFYRYTKMDIEQASFSSNMHMTESEKLGISMEEKKISVEDIKEELLDGNIVLLRLNAKPIRQSKRNTSNYIVVYGQNNNSFQIVDPLMGSLSIPEKVLRESFESLEAKKYRNHRMIVFLKN